MPDVWGITMDFKDTLEERLSDPEFCRELLAELREVIEENERLRGELARYQAGDELVQQAQELNMGYEEDSK